MYIIGSIYQWKPLKHFDWPISMIMATVTAQKYAAIETKCLFHHGGSWLSECDLVVDTQPQT